MVLPAINFVSALLPFYTEQGDNTKIILNNGKSIIIAKPLHSVIAIYAAQNSLDLKTLRKNIQKTICRKTMLPLPFARFAVFFPVKVRTPRIKRDACNGYINLYHFVDAIPAPQPYCSEIKLKNNITIPCLWKVESIKKHALLARLVRSTGACFPDFQDLEKVDAAASALLNLLEIIKII